MEKLIQKLIQKLEYQSDVFIDMSNNSWSNDATVDRALACHRIYTGVILELREIDQHYVPKSEVHTKEDVIWAYRDGYLDPTDPTDICANQLVLEQSKTYYNRKFPNHPKA